ncbi:TPA: GNAT family N-acetyltransferase [Photobacterium damselae]|nr:GNAT family N-acetyltransferase [Photobacterium damselae]
MFTLDVDKDLKLALVCPQFAPQYLEVVNRDRAYLSQWLSWPELAQDEAFFLSYIKFSLLNYADGRALVCAVIYQNALVGTVSLNHIDETLKKVEMGYWVSEEYQGRGIITRSATTLIDMAFTDLGMLKVQISAAIENKASRKVCERLGLTLEGIITRAENINGRVVDHAVYGLSRTAWQRHRLS